jgi:hypothetical protein
VGTHVLQSLELGTAKTWTAGSGPAEGDFGWPAAALGRPRDDGFLGWRIARASGPLGSGIAGWRLPSSMNGMSAKRSSAANQLSVSVIIGVSILIATVDGNGLRPDNR